MKCQRRAGAHKVCSDVKLPSAAGIVPESRLAPSDLLITRRGRREQDASDSSEAAINAAAVVKGLEV